MMLYFISLRKLVCCMFFVIMLVESERPKFRSDYRYEKAFNAFYKVHNAPASWFRARIRCEAEGAELMVPANLDEADVMPLLTINLLSKFEGVFLGMHDLYSERTFVTLNGSMVMNTILALLWDQKEPAPNVGRCIAMHRNGRLYVCNCDRPLPFLCKISANKITYMSECDTFNPNWKLGFKNSCYMTHQEPQNWHDAYSTCFAAGGHLAILNNKTEAEYIKGLFKQVTDRRVPDSEFAFLGFSDILQRNHYRTIHGDHMDETVFSDWVMQCGQLHNESKTRQLRCGGISRSGLLAVNDCTIPAIFFCEKKLDLFDSNVDVVPEIKSTEAPMEQKTQEAPLRNRVQRKEKVKYHYMNYDSF